MMNKPFIKQLINFGLSEKEAQIYISLLELEAATVFETAKQSGVNRSSAYVVLEGLKKKGLVGISDDKKVRKYIAASPEVLLQATVQTTKKHEEIKEGIESILPELRALHKRTKRNPLVKVYEGKNGLITLFEDSLYLKDKKVRVVSSLEKVAELLPEYVPDFVHRRIQKNIQMISIHPTIDFMQEYKKFQKNTADQSMFIPKEQYKTPADFAIYDDKIAYMTAEGGGFGVLIESKDMAEVMKSVFDLAYEEAKRLSKKSKQKHSQVVTLN